MSSSISVNSSAIDGTASTAPLGLEPKMRTQLPASVASFDLGPLNLLTLPGISNRARQESNRPITYVLSLEPSVRNYISSGKKMNFSFVAVLQTAFVVPFFKIQSPV